MKPKKYPDILYGCWSKINNELVLFNKRIADNLIEIGENVAIYDRRQARNPAPTPAVAPKESDNALQKPTEDKNDALEGHSQAGDAMKSFPANLPKKRKRRTKAEIEAIEAMDKDW